MRNTVWIARLRVALVVMAGLVASAAASEIELVTGETLSVVIVDQSDSHVVVEHPALGTLTIAADQITAMTSDDVRLSVVQDEDAATETAADPATEAAAEDEKEWKSRFVFGTGGSTGNSDNQNLSILVTSLRETDEFRTALDAQYFWAATDGDRTTNRFTAGLLHDWLLPESRWFYFASGRFDNDEFQSWDQRLGLHGGIGYQLYDKDDFKLALRAGAGATREWGSRDDDWTPEALIGADLFWQISEQQVLRLGAVIFPNLDDTGEFRATSFADWSMLMDAESNMSLNARVEYDYQSLVDPGIDKNDVWFTAGLQFDF